MYCERPLIQIKKSDDKYPLLKTFNKTFVSSKWFNYYNYDINECIRQDYINCYACGKCTVCVNMRRYQWVRKMELERSYWDNAYMLTLTYNDEHIPWNKQLRLKDLQNFFKRLRKYWSHYEPLTRSWVKDYEFSYFATGEYGTRTNRPHYHVIIFTNYNFQLTPLKKTKNGTLFKSQEINKLWPFGFNSVVHCVSNQAFTYCATYSNKTFLKQRVNLRRKKYEREVCYIWDTFGSSYNTYCKVDERIKEYLEQNYKPEFYTFSKAIPLGSREENLDLCPSSLIKYKYGQEVKRLTGVNNKFKGYQADKIDVIKCSRAKDKAKLIYEMDKLYAKKDEIIMLDEFKKLENNYQDFKTFIESNDIELLSSNSVKNESSYQQLKINSSVF